MKEYLNEEDYQRAKKKITTISIVILAISLVLGIGVMICGVIAHHNAKKEATANQAAATTRLAEIEKEQADLDKQIEEKMSSCTPTDMDDLDFSNLSSLFTNTAQCTDQEMSLRSKKTELEQEAFLLKYADYEVHGVQFIMYYVFGGTIIIAGTMIAIAVYLFAKKREIRAFTIQQTMPVTQEAIGKMAPTVGNAIKEVTKGVTKGYREGLKDDPEDNNKTPDSNNKSE